VGLVLGGGGWGGGGGGGGGCWCDHIARNSYGEKYGYVKQIHLRTSSYLKNIHFRLLNNYTVF